MSKNTEYVTEMQARMNKFDADVRALSADAGAYGRAAYDERLKELHACRNAAQAAFVRVQAASESAGAQLHAGMETAWDTMQAALKKVSADLKS